MKTLFFKCGFLLWAIGLLIGCRTGTQMDSENKIQFDSLFVDQSYHLLGVDTNPKCSLQISFIYPIDYANRETLKLVQQQFVSGFFGDEFIDFSPKDVAEKYSENYLATYKAEETNFIRERENHESGMLESWYSYHETSHNQIVYNRNDIISIVNFTESYFGGAHGSHQYVNRVVDLKTGKRITENDIFIDDFSDGLAKIIVNEIALANQVEVAELENIGFFSIDEIYPNQNFFVDDTGITYTFNEYEIAAYVVGPVSVKIPYEKIQFFLRKGSPIIFMLF